MNSDQSVQPVNRSLISVASPAITCSSTTTNRKIAPALSLVNSNNFYHKKTFQDRRILAIHETLHKSGILFLVSIYCFLCNLNESKQAIGEKVELFASFYQDQFAMLPFIGELELTRDEFEVVLNLFDDFYIDYNFITLGSQKSVKNKGKLQQALSEWFKTRGVVMESNKEFSREVLSVALNDWYSHLQR
ncbi:hypothetical protein CANMA_003115 [Candida margitis]|uniref:uncharacterized protein n=1 Tax=Candida margitis TaxID=1775924 RepID=UPI0022264572|nr:uncharacterized protein CANMA_003115 [Candida margitis]KAI5967295.1 hypothetical protein CANMA_003115 [Candida margitis]